jgi:hypothetical protein
MTGLEALRHLGADRCTHLTQQRPGEQAAAHADLAVDGPHRNVDALGFQGFPPRQNVLVDAVDESAVEVEDDPGPADASPLVHATSLTV